MDDRCFQGGVSSATLQGRGLSDVPMPDVAGGMVSVPYDMGGMPLHDAAISQSIPVGALATALANAPPAEQRTVSVYIIFWFSRGVVKTF